jgi:hypothetical protein
MKLRRRDPWDFLRRIDEPLSLGATDWLTAYWGRHRTFYVGTGMEMDTTRSTASVTRCAWE